MPAIVLAAPLLSPSALAGMGTMATAFATAANRFGPSAINIINRSAQSLSNSMQTTFNFAARSVSGTTRALAEYGKGILRDPASIASYGFGRTSAGLRNDLQEFLRPEINAISGSFGNLTRVMKAQLSELKDVTLNGLAEIEQRGLQNFRL